MFKVDANSTWIDAPPALPEVEVLELKVHAMILTVATTDPATLPVITAIPPPLIAELALSTLFTMVTAEPTTCMPPPLPAPVDDVQPRPVTADEQPVKPLVVLKPFWIVSFSRTTSLLDRVNTLITPLFTFVPPPSNVHLVFSSGESHLTVTPPVVKGRAYGVGR